MQKDKNIVIQNNKLTEFLLYTSPKGEIKVEVFLYNENFWLTQERIAELFGVNRQAITKHLLNIYNEEELVEDSTCSILEHVQTEGERVVKRQVKFYNLDAIIAIG